MLFEEVNAVSPDATASPGFLDDGGKMGALMRSFDWSKSPLGDPITWPDALKTAVATCLSSRFPMVVWWGPELIMLYNDAWQPILGETKHPGGLGRPGAESWPETWPIVGKQFENALNGIASWSEDLLLASDRHGFLEECYFTYSHSPLRDASGQVVGVHSVVSETTARVLSERRLRVLRDLSNATLRATREGRTVEQTCRALVGLLCSSNPDAPLALLYLGDARGRAQLTASTGVDASLFPQSVCPGDADPWAISQMLRGGSSPVIVGGSTASSTPLPGGVWPEPTTQIVVLALMKSSQLEPCGVLLVGINPRLRLDQPYLDFLRLIAAQLEGSISTLQAIEREKRSAQAKELMVRELQHRTRNLLAVVQSISERTLSASSSLDEYRAEFSERLSALSRVQGLLSREPDEVIDLGELVQMELETLAASDRERIMVDGAAVALPQQAVQLLSLALHELMTNALKYGALHGPKGNLQIRWEANATSDASRMLRIKWIEHSVEPLFNSTAARRGFGRILIEQALPHQLGANTTFELSREGCNCVIELPVTP